ncbi:MAG: addiction module protein [Fimbriiglobus sp.]
MSAKDAVIAFVKSLPDGATVPDVVGAIDARFGPVDDASRELSREEWEDAWGAEAERRLADLEAGRTVGIPHELVMREMREKYG